MTSVFFVTEKRAPRPRSILIEQSELQSPRMASSSLPEGDDVTRLEAIDDGPLNFPA
jgi:hypothetical protein